MENRKLIDGCMRGELWAQKSIYEIHAPTMMSVCRRYVGNSETARDLMHDGFIKLFTKIHTYAGTGSFNGWMRRIFVTTALEYLRRNDVLRYSADITEVDFYAAEPDILDFERLSTDDLLACINSLPNGYRTVFNMHAIEGYSHVEIAAELNISESTSRSQYARARQLLQKAVMNIADIDSEGRMVKRIAIGS
jgi:RNA polymerase sigma-70 factor (ECF subfamily)